MYVHDELTWDEFAEKFREAFGREMTVPEHLWFHSLWTAAHNAKQEKAKGAAA